MNTNFLPHAELKWLEEANALQVKWFKLHMPVERFYEICGAAMQIIAAQRGSIWIADMSDSEGVFSKQIQEVLASTAMQEQAAAAGIKHILTVLPKVAGLSSLNTKSWLRKVQNMERQDNIVEFPTLETCIGWIKSR